MTPTLDITPLRSFVAIGTFGGFHRAAAALNLTQSAVSRHVAVLERATGRTLIDRRGRHVALTEDGRQLRTAAERILAAHDGAAARYALPSPEQLTIASADHVADELLPSLITRLREALPGVDLHLRTGRGPELRAAVDRGDIDIAIAFTGLTSDPEHPRGVALRWIASPTLRWEKDGPVPLVSFQQDSALRAAAFTLLAAHGLEGDLVGEAPDLAGVHALVRAGAGVALLPLLAGPPVHTVVVPALPQAPLAVLDISSRSDLTGEAAERAREAIQRTIECRDRPSRSDGALSLR
ncbi:MAG: LysR family transcriptional regulator [Acidobacteria bacterium]|nr:LysR family transcriptional regulator [Acidobacteriota bacterium]